MARDHNWLTRPPVDAGPAPSQEYFTHAPGKNLPLTWEQWARDEGVVEDYPNEADLSKQLPPSIMTDDGEPSRVYQFSRNRRDYQDDTPEDHQRDKFNSLIRDMRGQYYDPSLKYRSDLK